MESRQGIIAGILVVLWVAETWLPFFLDQHRTLRERLRHDARNLTWGIGNALFVAICLSGIFVAINGWATTHDVGLLRQLDLPIWLSTCLAVVLMDIWTYWWHRFNHLVPFLWRFHRMHHSDTAMNVSTAARFHTGELLLSRLAWLVIVPLWGVSLNQLAIYEALLLPVVLLHHSNLRLPRWLEVGLTALVVTPAMHRVHHSRIREETNSNYSSLLSWWDMVFASFRWRKDVENIRYGVDEFADPHWQTLGGMARTPLESRETPPADHETI